MNQSNNNSSVVINSQGNKTSQEFKYPTDLCEVYESMPEMGIVIETENDYDYPIQNPPTPYN